MNSKQLVVIFSIFLAITCEFFIQSLNAKEIDDIDSFMKQFDKTKESDVEIYSKAFNLYQSNKYNKAQNILETLIRQLPDSEKTYALKLNAFSLLGSIYHRSKRYELAKSVFDKQLLLRRKIYLKLESIMPANTPKKDIELFRSIGILDGFIQSKNYKDLSYLSMFKKFPIGDLKQLVNAKDAFLLGYITNSAIVFDYTETLHVDAESYIDFLVRSDQVFFRSSKYYSSLIPKKQFIESKQITELVDALICTSNNMAKGAKAQACLDKANEIYKSQGLPNHRTELLMTILQNNINLLKNNYSIDIQKLLSIEKKVSIEFGENHLFTATYYTSVGSSYNKRNANNPNINKKQKLQNYEHMMNYYDLAYDIYKNSNLISSSSAKAMAQAYAMVASLAGMTVINPAVAREQEKYIKLIKKMKEGYSSDYIKHTTEIMEQGRLGIQELSQAIANEYDKVITNNVSISPVSISDASMHAYMDILMTVLDTTSDAAVSEFEFQLSQQKNKDNRESGKIYIKSAAAYLNAGIHSPTEDYLHHALKIFNRENGSDSFLRSKALLNLARLQFQKRNFMDAIGLANKSLTISQRNLPKGHEHIDDSLVFLGRIYLELSWTQKALETINEIQPERYSIDHLDKLTNKDIESFSGKKYYEQLLITYAVLLHKQGSIEKAINILSILSDSSKKPTDIPSDSNVYAAIPYIEILLETEQWELAIEVVEKSIRSAKIRFGENHQVLARLLSLYASSIVKDTSTNNQKNLKLALEHSSKAVDILIANHSQQTSTYQDNLINIEEQLREIYEQHIDLLYMAQKQGIIDDAETIPRTIIAAQSALFTSLSDTSNKMAARFASGSSEIANLVRKQQDTIETIKNTKAEYTAVLSGQLKSKSSASSILQKSKNLSKELERINKKIKNEYPKYFQLITNNNVPLNKIMASVPENSAILVYLVSNDNTYLWAIKQYDAAFKQINIPREKLTQYVADVRFSMNLSENQKLHPFSVDDSYHLYKKILHPVDDFISDIDTLYVIPDGPLTSMPFSLLVQEKSINNNGLTNYQSQKWLINNYAVSTLPNLSTLVILKNDTSNSAALKSFLGFGAPKLRGTSHNINKLSDNLSNSILNIDMRSVLKEDLLSLRPLKEAENELMMMSRNFKVESSDIYTDNMATENTFRGLDLLKYRYVAIATHALLSNELSLSEPGLVFTPGDKDVNPTNDDGILLASELAQLKFDANWMILSACNTAYSGNYEATGLSPLVRSSLYAGTRSLLVSHWAVDDKSTSILTSQTVKRSINNQIPSKSLQLSMKDMLSGKHGEKYSHPYYWAPFIYIGI